MTALQSKWFIAGTDTGVGKTLFTAALTVALQNAGQSVIALKPIAAGCELIEGERRNEDAIILQQSMSEKVPYKVINPIPLDAPVAPHIAAKAENIELSVKQIKQLSPLSQFEQSHLLVEGAGGWLVPLNDIETLADYAKSEKMDVILVVGIKLGCINHALLSQKCIEADGLNLVGWVANYIDPLMQSRQQNIESLTERLNCPLMAEIPFLEGNNLVVDAAQYVNIQQINRSYS